MNRSNEPIFPAGRAYITHLVASAPSLWSALKTKYSSHPSVNLHRSLHAFERFLSESSAEPVILIGTLLAALSKYTAALATTRRSGRPSEHKTVVLEVLVEDEEIVDVEVVVVVAVEVLDVDEEVDVVVVDRLVVLLEVVVEVAEVEVLLVVEVEENVMVLVVTEVTVLVLELPVVLLVVPVCVQEEELVLLVVDV